MNEYLRNKKPQRKPPHDLIVRLGNKKPLKAKLQKIAGKNQMSVNKLMIKIICWFIDAYESGKDFTIMLK